MKVGDILEWFAGTAFVAAAYLATHRAWPAVVVAAAVLVYEAQCYSDSKIPRPKLPKLPKLPKRRRKGKR